MNREHILRKVKACLRLAASSNPNEAAAALRQAQAMMRAHGISHAEAMEVDEAEVGTRFRGAMPVVSISRLALLVADGFGARMIVCTEQASRGGSTVIRYYGTDGAAEIAAYAFTVLRRQLDADRLKHIARIRKRGNREARGEVFARAWVFAVSSLFPAATVDEEKRLAVDQVFQQRYPNSTTGVGRDLTKRGKATENDAVAGYTAGKSARISRAVNGTSQSGLEHLP